MKKRHYTKRAQPSGSIPTSPSSFYKTRNFYRHMNKNKNYDLKKKVQ